MTTSLLHAVVRVADARTPDADLLERFIRTKDETAFEELVRRHGPLVWSVCRQLLPHHADAEDAFQAVFLALVRGAGGIRAGQALPGWLHGVAVRVAARVKRAAVRRRQREERAAVGEADRPVPDAAWAALMTAVHEEVQQLPAAERTAFILCDLEGVRQPDAAARLGWPIGTLSGRLCKARQKLLDQLMRRGIAPAVLALGGLAGSAGSVPAALVAQVSSFPTAVAGGIPSTVAALAGGLVEGVTMRMKIAAAALLVAGAFGLSGGAMVLSQADAQGGGSSGGPPPGMATGAGAFQPGSGGAVVVPSGQGGGIPNSGAVLFPSGGQGGLLIAGGDGPALFAAPGQSGGGGQGPAFGGVMIGGASRWEYKFVELKSDDRGPFEKEITSAGNDGWEYAGSERLRKGNDAAQIVLVFKRPKGGALTGMPGMGGGGFGGLGGGGFGGGGGLGGGMFGGGGGGKGFVEVESRVIKLKNSTAPDVAKAVEKAFPGAKNQVLKVIAEPVTNAVVIVADPATMKEIVKLIDSLDGKGGDGPKGPGPGPGGAGPRPGGGGPPGMGGGSGSGMPGMGGGNQGGARPIRVITLRFASADELAPVLKRVFANADVTPESRTNQLIIRADEKTTADLEALIQRLDVQVKK